MHIYAIGDLHLPGGDKKPMDIFGAHWLNHFEKISADWRARVAVEDVVLIPGDISWAMQLEQALPDLEAIAALPGQKVLLRGNHDYWWSSISKLRSALPDGMYALQNDALALGDTVFCGSRGWLSPDTPSAGADDVRIYERELGRLALSLQGGEKLREALQAQGIAPRLIALLHYPPYAEKGRATEVTALLSQYGVCDAVYGHLHGPGHVGGYVDTMDGVRYHLTSCDSLDFALYDLPGNAE